MGSVILSEEVACLVHLSTSGREGWTRDREPISQGGDARIVGVAGQD